MVRALPGLALGNGSALTAIDVEPTSDWSPDLAAFAARARGRSFAAGDGFRRAMALHVPGWAPCTLVARAEGAIVGLLPGYVARKAGGAWLHALPLNAPAGPMLAPGATDDAAVVAALWQGLDRVARRFGWLGGQVTLAPPAAASEALWPPAALGNLRMEESHVVDLAAGYAAWLDGLRHRARKQLVKAEGHGVEVRESRDPDDLARVYALYVEQARGWGKGRVRPQGFYASMLVPPTSARLWVARANGTILCGTIAFVDPEETYLWWSGSSPAARDTLAFPALLAGVMRDCGSRTVNLGFSGGQKRLTDFKEQMGAVEQRVPILDLAPRPRTPYHALLAAAHRSLVR